MHHRVFFSLAALAALAAACRPGAETGDEPRAETGKLSVFVVNYPLRYFAERIGGDAVEVELPVPAAVDPAFWKPLPEDIAGFQRADVILLNGAGYGEWVETASLPPSKLVDTSRSFHDRLIRVEDLVRHSHGPEGEHSHAGTAFTTWLDPTLALEHARAVRAAFAELRPETEAAFETGFLALERDLLDLDERLRAIVARDPKRPLLASHPVYQYLARRYGLDLKSVHWEPDEAPLDEMWKELRALLASHPARWMLWEGRPLDETVRKLEALGVRSVVFAPCANVPEAGDWLDAQRENARSLEAVFAAEAPAR